MSVALIPSWSDVERTTFLKEPVMFKHGLLETGQFSEEAIARLLETHPDQLTDVNINDISDDGTSRVRTGTRGGLSGEKMLEAIKAGRLWINLREAFTTDRGGSSIVSRFFAELEAHNPGLKTFHVYANLLLSGPQARVPYHADTPGVVLMHLVGKKRVWLYPNGDKFLRDEAMEKVALKETTEDLPYDPAWDGEAFVADLTPGYGLTWPFNAPHRVDNQGTFNVSLSCEFMTWEARLRHGTYYTNGTLRRRFGVTPKEYHHTSQIGRVARFGASVALKKLGINKARQAVYQTEFDVGKGVTG